MTADLSEKISDKLITFLPVATAESLSPVLTHDDVDTLRYLHKKSIPENTLRAIAGDLAYLEAWHLAATNTHLEWPASEDVVLKFIAHHLFDAQERKSNVRHGMPERAANRLHAQERLQTLLPHAPSTVRRRISHWKRLHVAKGEGHEFDNPQVKAALKAAIKSSNHKIEKKSAKPITKEVLEQMIKTLDVYRSNGRRDKALLYLAFASGGRRRSELSDLRIENIEDVSEQTGPRIFRIYLSRAKRIRSDDGESIIVSGKAALALMDWLKDVEREFGKASMGPIFRGINRWGAINEHPISPGAVNDIVKRAISLAGYDAGEYSAHGIRSGYLTEARNQGVPLEDAMRHSKHRSYQVASSYYQREDERTSKAVSLLD